MPGTAGFPEDEPCPFCKGTGVIDFPSMIESGQIKLDPEDDPADYEVEECEPCNGTGRVKSAGQTMQDMTRGLQNFAEGKATFGTKIDQQTAGLSTEGAAFSPTWQAKNASEPMDLSWRLLKDRKSPEAFRHKKEYDTKYESSPERVKYREELNRERRRRGMYGDHSGRDISHTEGGKLTVEGAHENRARHFKDQGTLRHVGVKKKVNDARKANLIGVVPPLKGENE